MDRLLKAEIVSRHVLNGLTVLRMKGINCETSAFIEGMTSLDQNVHEGGHSLIIQGEIPILLSCSAGSTLSVNKDDCLQAIRNKQKAEIMKILEHRIDTGAIESKAVLNLMCSDAIADIYTIN